MTPSVRPLVAGNWKMNGLKNALGEIVAIRQGIETGAACKTQVAVCPPLTLLCSAAERLEGSGIALGGQDCHSEAFGPFTGSVSAEMIKDAGASFVIVGHSERRTAYSETNAIVKAKAEAAVRAGLIAIVCVGETGNEREAGEEIAVVSAQVRGSLADSATSENTIVAYEPLWAIGSGMTPTPSDIAAMHASIRTLLKEICNQAGATMRILYGGSVKPENVKDLLGLLNVDGALVGGASLKAADFLAVVRAFG